MKPQKCSCGKKATRDLITEHSGGGVDCMNREYEFYGSSGTRMYAASYLDLAEAKKVHPNTDFRLHNEAWLPVIRNRIHKLKYLNEMGFVEKN